jgi:hypothetical protein
MDRPDVHEALRRLLGSEAPEIDCDVCFAEIDRYVELELAGLDADEAVPGMRAQQHDALRGFLRGDPATP